MNRGFCITVVLALIAMGLGLGASGRKLSSGVVRELIVLPSSLDQKTRQNVERGIVLRVGEPFTAERLHVSQQILRAISSIEDIECGVEETRSGVRVSFTIKKRPTIREIKIIGSRNVNRQELIDLVPIAPDDFWNESYAKTTQQKVEGYLRDHGFLDGRADITTAPAPGGNEGDKILAIQVEEGAQWKLGLLEFRGNRAISDAELRREFTIKPGDHFSIRRLDESIKNLQEVYFKRHFFQAKISFPAFRREEKEKTVSVVVVINEEKAIYFKMQNGDLSEGDLLLMIKPSESRFSKWFVDEAVEVVREYYVKQGYFRANVKAQVMNEDQRTEVTFETTLGSKVYLQEIRFRNNRAFSDNRLQSIMFNLLGSAYKRRPFREADFQSALKELPNYYREAGFLRATIVSTEIQVGEDEREARAEVVIEEGGQYILGAVRVEGNAHIEDETIVQAVGQRVGRPINYFELDNIKSRIQSLYANRGYVRAEIAVELDLEKVPSESALVIRIDEKQQVRVGQIILSGNRYTNDEVILRELSIHPGDVLIPSKVLESQADVQQLGLFRSVFMRELEIPDESAPLAHFILEVRERPRITLEVGPGYGTEDGARVILTAESRFGGTGRRVSLRSKLSRRIETSAQRSEPLIDNDRESRPFIERDTTISYLEPRLLGSKYDWRFSITEQKKMDALLDRYNVNLNTGFSRRFLKQFTGDAQFRVEYSNPFNVVQRADVTAAQGRKKILNSLFTGWDFSRRDDFFLPALGIDLHGEAEVFSSIIASDVDFWKIDLRTVGFIPIGNVISRKAILAITVRSGFSMPYGGTQDVPIEKNFKLGGEMTVRGFGYDSINPVDYTGGESYFNYRLELSVPIISDFDMMIFQDGGNTFRRAADWRPFDLRFTVGPGIRWNTPVGPLKAGVGVILGRKATESWGSFFFGVGPS